MFFRNEPVQASQTTATITVAAYPTNAGTITGAGSFAFGTTNKIRIKANPGWYIQSVVIDPPTPLTENPPNDERGNLYRQLVLKSLSAGDASDVTTIVSSVETMEATVDRVVTVVFSDLSPKLVQDPERPLATNFLVLAGTPFTFSPSIHGRYPVSYQWYLNHEPLVGKTSQEFSIKLSTNHSGEYSVVASNKFGMSTNFISTIDVRELLAQIGFGAPYLGGPEITTLPLDNGIGLLSSIPEARIYYTLNGTEPNRNSTRYTQEIRYSSDVTLRAIAYSSDFSRSATFSIKINVPPYGYLSGIDDVGPGYLSVLPAYARAYALGTEITLDAIPQEGWSFIDWNGSLAGRPSITTLKFEEPGPIKVEPLFGTEIHTTVKGNGSIELMPNFPLYLAGSLVRVTAVPAPGFYFAGWEGDASIEVSHSFEHYISTPQNSITARFEPLPANEFSLTVHTPPGTSFSRQPSANKYAQGTKVRLYVISQVAPFMGWAGDATGTNLPLFVTMDGNKDITVLLENVPRLTFQGRKSGTINLTLKGVAGSRYEMQESEDLLTWKPAFIVTNYYSERIFTLAPSREVPHKFFKPLQRN